MLLLYLGLHPKNPTAGASLAAMELPWREAVDASLLPVAEPSPRLSETNESADVAELTVQCALEENCILLRCSISWRLVMFVSDIYFFTIVHSSA